MTEERDTTLKPMSEDQKRVVDWVRALGGIGALLAICALIWNASAANSRIMVNTTRLDSIEAVGSDTLRTYTSKTDQILLDQGSRITRLEASINQNNMDHTVILQRLATIEALIRSKP
jgi:hypothetical protein